MKISFVIICLCFSLFISAATKYELCEGGDCRDVFFARQPTDSLLMYKYWEGSEYQISYYNDNNISERFSLIDSTENTDLNVVSRKNEIFVDGIFRDKIIDKKFDLGETPWRQSMSYSLGEFVLSDEKTIVFWIFRIDNLSLFKIKAVKVAQESIIIEEKTYDTTKVKIQPAGLFSVFWKGYYWLRNSDGLFLKFESAGNIPGIKKRTLIINE